MENLAKQTDITAMQPAGRVLPLWRGEYRNGEFYEQTDIVLYNNSSYIAKQDTIGNLPPESANANDYWQLVAKGIIDADISDATVEFEEALTRENIESGEAAETLFGKIRKIFADLKPIAFTESYSDLKNTPGVVSKSSDGLVQKGDGQANKVWKTDNNGNPGWRDDVNTQAITSVNGKTGAVTLTAADVNACPATGVIDKLTNIGQITGIGFWAIGSIDNAYATSIGIDNNAGDFYALVLSYNGNGIDFFNFGTIILTTPRINGFHYEIQIWEGRASAVKTLNNRSVLNTIEEISANTESRNVAGALAAKTMMADYNAKINQINSKIGIPLKWIGEPPGNSANNAINMGVYGTTPSSEITDNWGVLIVFTNGDTNYNRWVFQFWLSTSGNMYQRRKINDDAWTELMRMN